MKPEKTFVGKSHKPIVLHIEDDSNDVELFRAAARKARAPLHIQSAADAAQAIAYLEAIPRNGDAGAPSVILLDLHLPRDTGLEFLRWLRAHPDLRDIPVVVLSGSERATDRERALNAGAASYFVKPLGIEPLVGLIGHIAGKWCAPRAE